MLKNISKLNGTQQLDKTQQKAINGGFNCAACYDSCLRTSRDRIELGECFDYCQAYIC